MGDVNCSGSVNSVDALIILRAVDGLTPLTAAFVIAAFGVAEYVLSGRAIRSGRR